MKVLKVKAEKSVKINFRTGQNDPSVFLVLKMRVTCTRIYLIPPFMWMFLQKELKLYIMDLLRYKEAFIYYSHQGIIILAVNKAHSFPSKLFNKSFIFLSHVLLKFFFKFQKKLLRMTKTCSFLQKNKKKKMLVPNIVFFLFSIFLFCITLVKNAFEN